MNQSASKAVFAIFDEFRSRKDVLSPVLLANRILEQHLSLSATEVADIGAMISRFLGPRGVFPIPSLLLPVVSALISNRGYKIVCDPWAGIGTMLATVQEATQATTAIAITQNNEEYALGKALVGSAEWKIGDPIDLLSQAPELDLVVSVLPFGARSRRPLVLPGLGDNTIEINGDLGDLLLTASAMRLSHDGIGIYIVPPSFFFSRGSVRRHFGEIGLSVEAALALPPGSFAPYTNIETYLIVVKKTAVDRIFVGALSSDAQANFQVISNFREGNAEGALELGRYVDAAGFTGLNSIRIEERLEQASVTFGAPAIRLGELALAITLGRPGDSFQFSAAENTLFFAVDWHQRCS
jgi:hypothetical protein